MNKSLNSLKHWREMAKKIKDVKTLTHCDIHQRQLEINAISSCLTKKDEALDLGCGNGFSTAIFAKFCHHITGVDISEEMIKRAKQENSKKGKIDFILADARNFSFGRKFNKIITERCLINILDWEEQKKAIANIATNLEKHGYFLMVEGVKDGRDCLNEMRKKIGIGTMPKVIYNLDFEKKQTDKFLNKYFYIEKFITFGIYELITRIIMPRYIFPKNPEYGSKFHEIAYEICNKIVDPVPQISKLGFWVLRKKL